MESTWHGSFSVTLFGGSHTPTCGVIIAGLKAGLPVDLAALQSFLKRRAPLGRAGDTARREADEPFFQSGIQDGLTDGTPIVAIFQNADAQPAAYQPFFAQPRPSHVDYAARMRYGDAVDLRGGGHFSARMTAPLCLAGGIALQQLQLLGVRIAAHLLFVGNEPDTRLDDLSCDPFSLPDMGDVAFPTLDADAGARMQAKILNAQVEGDTLGGVIECVAKGVPAGLGDPIFSGLDSRLASLLFSIPAVRGVEFGAGYAAAHMRGSENNDVYCIQNGKVRTETNRHGGILGGMTTGMPIRFTVAVKPASSIQKPQTTLNLLTGEQALLTIAGRHDVCPAVRAVPVVEAVTALALYDLILEDRT